MKAVVTMALLAVGMPDMNHDRVAAEETAFRAEASRSMDRMMRDMQSRPMASADEDFVAMMTPHHQGAIEMAQSELRHGRNEMLRRIAQEIIVEQQQEIVAMHAALALPVPTSSSTPGRP